MAATEYDPRAAATWSITERGPSAIGRRRGRRRFFRCDFRALRSAGILALFLLKEARAAAIRTRTSSREGPIRGKEAGDPITRMSQLIEAGFDKCL